MRRLLCIVLVNILVILALTGFDNNTRVAKEDFNEFPTPADCTPKDLQSRPVKVRIPQSKKETEEVTNTNNTWLDASYVRDRYLEEIEPRYVFTEDEIYLLAQLLCGSEEIDGDGEYDFVWGFEHDKPNYYETYKVLDVVMNRVRDERFPNTIKKVILQRNAFEVMPKNLKKKPSETALRVVSEWCEMYSNWEPEAQVVPQNHVYFEAGPHLTNVTRADYKN
jgi:hypothetical protein